MSRADVLAALEERAREVRARAAVRAWEYRQRHHAKGVWFRLRRLLAATASAWSLPEEEARRLVAEGYEAADVGGLLEPPKLLVVVPEERLRTIAARTPVELRLGPELLAARCLALVPFRRPETPPAPGGEAAAGDPLVPNEETIEAMKAARRGELVTLGPVDDLLTDLHEDE